MGANPLTEMVLRNEGKDLPSYYYYSLAYVFNYLYVISIKTGCERVKRSTPTCHGIPDNSQ